MEEKAWNAYPYTKTVFSCPFVEKFSLEIETFYTPDGGQKENVFNLSVSFTIFIVIIELTLDVIHLLLFRIPSCAIVWWI